MTFQPKEEMRAGVYNPRWGRIAARLDGSVIVHVRGGVYPVREPVVFTPQDSYPVTFRAHAGERPVLDGGTRITEWQSTEINCRKCCVINSSFTLSEPTNPFMTHAHIKNFKR